MSPVDVRPMQRADIAFAVQLHTEALHPGFFVRLGPRFLTAYYRTYLASPSAIALVAEQRGERVGFLVGIVDRDSHYRHVIRNERLGLGFALLASLAARPALVSRFIRTRLVRYARGIRRHQRSISISQPRLGCPGVLSHVAVCEAFRRTGVGQALVSHFVDGARSSGTTRLSLIALADDPSTSTFYEQQGWEFEGVRRDADGFKWTTYSLGLA